MKNLLFIAMFSLLFTSFGFSQKGVIIVENSTNSSIYYELDSALHYAQDGDIVYIPAGAFSCTNDCEIDKELHIRGVGHNPLTTSATGRTVINDDFVLKIGADNSTITGLYVIGSIQYKTNNVVNNIQISRCNTSSLYLRNRNSLNCTISECIVRNDLYAYAQNIIIQNSILYDTPQYLHFGTVKNCIIFDSNFFPLDNDFSTYNNNIILGTNSNVNSNDNISSNNNIFVMSTIPTALNDVGSFAAQSVTTIFNNPINTTFTYADDYHLSPTSVGKNAGTDGNDIGIYGGVIPFKDNMMPFAPHITSKIIPGATNAAGHIQIMFQVESQGN